MDISEMRKGMLGYRLHGVDLRVERAHSGRLRPYGVSFQQATALVFLTDRAARGGVNQRAIQDYTKLSNPAVVKIGRELERLGLVVRGEDPEDGRSRLLWPTEKGKERAERFRALVAETDQACFSVLTEREKQTLNDLLDKLEKAEAL